MEIHESEGVLNDSEVRWERFCSSLCRHLRLCPVFRTHLRVQREHFLFHFYMNASQPFISSQTEIS